MSITSTNLPLSKLLKGKSKWGLFSSKTIEEEYYLHLNENTLINSNNSSIITSISSSSLSSLPSSPLSSSNSIENINKLLEQLQNEVKNKNDIISNLENQLNQLKNINKNQNNSFIIPRKHNLATETYLISDEGSERVPVATRGSVLTTNLLRALGEQPPSSTTLLAQKFITTFQKPLEHINYLQSKEFANDIIEICYAVCDILENESRCLFIQSPAYVIGDIHGNLEDLHFFADNLWPLGMELSAGKFLFLGDYVDRGMNCLECIAYLFALKTLSPAKIYLLRGNHETRSVNGWEEHYKTKSFLYQCKERFGVELGESVWEEVNQCFDRLPLAGIIDHDIFCIHGGIPRPLSEDYNAINDILTLPNLLGVNPSYEHETSEMIQIVSDCLWSDPANEEQEECLNHYGFGPSLRGQDCICFGMKAIDNFLKNNELSFIIRAHEAHAHGVSLSKAAKVFTVFSTSKDHGQGTRAIAGCILVDADKIQVINRSPAYKNKYIHHRTSIGVELTDDQLLELSRLGLLRMDSIDGKRGK